MSTNRQSTKSTPPPDPGASRALPPLARLGRFLGRLWTPGDQPADTARTSPPAAEQDGETAGGDQLAEDPAQVLSALPPPRASRVGAPQPRTARAQQSIGPLNGNLIPAQPFAGRPTGLWFLAGQPEAGGGPPVGPTAVGPDGIADGLLVAGSMAKRRRMERFESWRNPSGAATPARHPDTGQPLARVARGQAPIVEVTEPVSSGRPPVGPLLPDPPDLDAYEPTARGLVPPARCP